jgi:hypothetical protein
MVSVFWDFAFVDYFFHTYSVMFVSDSNELRSAWPLSLVDRNGPKESHFQYIKIIRNFLKVIHMIKRSRHFYYKDSIMCDDSMQYLTFYPLFISTDRGECSV